MASAKRRANHRYVSARPRGNIYTGLPGVPPTMAAGANDTKAKRQKLTPAPRRKRMLLPHLTTKGVWSLRWAQVEVTEGSQ